MAVLNADDAAGAARSREMHPGRTVTFGFAEDADVRAESVRSYAPTARVSARWAWISRPAWRAGTR